MTEKISRRALFAGVGGGAAFLALNSTTTAFGNDLRKVSIGLSSTSFISVPVRVTNDAGFFRKHGLSVDVQVTPDASVGMAALITGSLDFMVAGAVNALMSRLRNQEVIVVSSVYRGFAGSLVLSSDVVAKLGLSEGAPTSERLKALDGLLLASPSASSNYTLTPLAAAKTVGANLRFTYMEQVAMPAALEVGAIQGYISGAPFWVRNVADGKGVLWLSGPKGDFADEAIPASSSLLETMCGYADANPDVVRAIRASMSEFVNFAQQKPDEVISYVRNLYPSLNEETAKILLGAESKAWANSRYTIDDLQHDIKYVRAGGITLDGIERIDLGSLILQDNQI